MSRLGIKRAGKHGTPRTGIRMRLLPRPRLLGVTAMDMGKPRILFGVVLWPAGLVLCFLPERFALLGCCDLSLLGLRQWLSSNQGPILDSALRASIAIILSWRSFDPRLVDGLLQPELQLSHCLLHGPVKVWLDGAQLLPSDYVSMPKPAGGRARSFLRPRVVRIENNTGEMDHQGCTKLPCVEHAKAAERHDDNCPENRRSAPLWGGSLARGGFQSCDADGFAVHQAVRHSRVHILPFLYHPGVCLSPRFVTRGRLECELISDRQVSVTTLRPESSAEFERDNPGPVPFESFSRKLSNLPMIATSMRLFPSACCS
mmetsp:Transcript_25834/g.72342  ORF Transcript_25834/g.72342 Transcript_25834/m.72342 type:complete len:316 (+) Transcript_25834:1018-1965(+)